jgi:hypothetical protein
VLRAVEILAWVVFAVCAALLFAIRAVRFCCFYGVALLVLFCCLGGVVLWAGGG